MCLHCVNRAQQMTEVLHRRHQQQTYFLLQSASDRSQLLLFSQVFSAAGNSTTLTLDSCCTHSCTLMYLISIHHYIIWITISYHNIKWHKILSLLSSPPQRTRPLLLSTAAAAALIPWQFKSSTWTHSYFQQFGKRQAQSDDPDYLQKNVQPTNHLLCKTDAALIASSTHFKSSTWAHSYLQQVKRNRNTFTINSCCTCLSSTC